MVKFKWNDDNDYILLYRRLSVIVIVVIFTETVEVFAWEEQKKK